VIVLDTTVLVYAVGAQHPLRDPCRRIVEGVREQRIDATTTVEVLQEFAHVRARRRSREDAAALTGEFLELLAPLLVVEEHQLRTGLALYQRGERLGAFDSVLAATALHAGAQALVSADVSFADVRNLRHVFPDARSVEALEAM
jgi:predicted nucleic acid-binding protein